MRSHVRYPGWGFQLLPEDDFIYFEPDFFANMIHHSGPNGHVMDLNNKASGIAFFAEQWAEPAPKGVQVMWFNQSGSDAVNSFYDIARATVRDRPRGRNPDLAEVVSFEGSYVAGAGQGLKLNDIIKYHANVPHDLKLASPYTPYF